MTLLRRARALLLSLEGRDLLSFNFLTRTRAVLPTHALTLLSTLDTWRPPAEVFTDAADRPARARDLLALLDARAVLVAGTAEAAEDARVDEEWPWGAIAGHYHFGIKDPGYQAPAAAFLTVAARAATQPPIALVARHAAPTVTLSPPPLDDGLLALMARRRSYRGFARDAALPLEALRDCLFSGLGIVGFLDSPVPGEGRLPLKMTPSGGARNPYEAYVVARNVAGLEPAVYHYAGLGNSLARVAAAPAQLAPLAGGQAWFDDAAALVLLVASFDRCAWKYAHPTGFRVVLLEAGHIAQNILLAATAHGLAATPTCALGDRVVEELLGLDRIRQAAIHAVALGVRGPPSPADLPPTLL